MKFRINTEVFLNAVKPVVDIALKNVEKVNWSHKAKDYDDDDIISIEATPEELILHSRYDLARIVVRLKLCDGYILGQEGGFTVWAKELIPGLQRFSSFDDLCISAGEGHLKITSESDKEIYTSILGVPETIILPSFPKNYDQQVTVDKAYFVKGLQKVAYAQASNEKMYCYMCALFESNNNKIRFSAGSGGRFAVVEYESDTKIIASDEMKVIFPRTNVSNIIRIFKKISCSTIKITSYDSDIKAQTPKQIVLEADNIVLCIYGLEYFTGYHDLNSIICYDYHFQISTHIKDWKSITDAIDASKKSAGGSIHNTKVVADLLHGYFDISTTTGTKVKERIHFALGTYVTDPNKEKCYKPWFCTDSNNIVEMAKKAGKADVVTINFEDQAIPASIPDDKPKRAKPVLLKFLKKANKEGIKEKGFIFFTVSFR